MRTTAARKRNKVGKKRSIDSDGIGPFTIHTTIAMKAVAASSPVTENRIMKIKVQVRMVRKQVLGNQLIAIDRRVPIALDIDTPVVCFDHQVVHCVFSLSNRVECKSDFSIRILENSRHNY
jgi:hypothetical protein